MGEKQFLRIREGGHVRRCHTIPHIGEYTVASHSWHAAVLLLHLHQTPSKSLLAYMLLHDVHERWLGDVPSPAKWRCTFLKAACDKNEEELDALLGFDRGKAILTENEKKWARAIDALEFWLWTLDQKAMGNQHVRQEGENVERWFEENRHELPKQVWNFYCYFVWDRTGAPDDDF